MYSSHESKVSPTGLNLSITAYNPLRIHYATSEHERQYKRYTNYVTQMVVDVGDSLLFGFNKYLKYTMLSC